MTNLAIPGLLDQVRRYGRFDMNACLNCGSCTLVCNLSENNASFPRRPIQKAIYGFKKSLRGSLEPWLCHDCGDCSTTCPRQAEPRESMMTLRRYLIGQYDPTGIAARILRSKAWELTAIFLTAAIVFALALYYHLYYVELTLPDLISTPMGMEHMFGMIVDFTIIVFLIPLFILLISTIRMQRFAMARDSDLKIPIRLYFVEVLTVFVHMFTHKNIKKCTGEIHKKRWTKHWLLGLAVSLMIIIKVFFLTWFQTDSIYPIYHPQRWLGYFATVVMIYVSFDILRSRIKKQEAMHKFSELSDLTLPIMLMLVAISGIAVHIFRYLEFSMACHFTYAIHLAIAVPLVVVELPFGKWAHTIYRPLAIYFQSVKERALAETKQLVEEKPAEELIIKGTQTV